MARYELLYLPSIAKDLRGVPKADVRRILARAEQLRDDPYPPNSLKLEGQDHYRIRQDNFRILYSVDDGRVIIIIIKVGHRRDVYRR